MTSTEKKMMTATMQMLSPTPESTLIPSLPDDLLLNCFARGSTLYYLTISLVSKRFRSLLTSPEFHQTRSLLGRTESRLFVCFRSSPDGNLRWFSLCLKPNQTLTNANSKKSKKKKPSSGYVLAPIPIPKSPQAVSEGHMVAVGSNIYVIGGPNTPSSSVSVLDCRSYTWREAPSMCRERHYTTINVFDGKIYVAGGCKDCDSWMEVFDPETQTWKLVSMSPLATQSCGDGVHISATIKGEIVMFGYRGVAYKPKEDRWEAIEEEYEMVLGWIGPCSCVIDDVLYSMYTLRVIKWYDSKRRSWKNVKGLDSLPNVARNGFKRLVNYDGKILVLWDDSSSSGEKEKGIWCGVIAVERRNEDEIWGNMEWFDGVLTVPESHEFVCAVAPTV